MPADIEHRQSAISARHPLQACRHEQSAAATEACGIQTSSKEKLRAQKANEQWERDAGNVCVPEVKEDDVKPSKVAPETYDVVADVAEQLQRPKAPEETTQGNEVASEVKEVEDGTITDDEGPP